MRMRELDLFRKDNTSLVFITGIFFAICNNLVYPFVNLFLMRIGGNDTHIALLSSLQGFFSVLTIFAVVIVLQYATVKDTSALSMFMVRGFYLLFVLITFLPIEFQPIGFVILYGIKFIPNTFYNVASTSLWSEVIEVENERARVLSLRNVLVNVTSLIVVLTTGLILSKFPKSHEELINYYKVFFCIAFIIGIFEYIQYKRFNVEKGKSILLTFKGIKDKLFLDDIKSDFVVLKEIVKKKHFKLFFGVLLIAYMGWTLPIPLYPVYEFNALNSNELWASISTSVCLVMQAVGFVIWGKLVRKYDVYILLTICFFLQVVDIMVYRELTSMSQVILFNVVNHINVAGFMYLPLLALYKEIESYGKIKNYFVSLYFIFTGVPQIFMPSITLLITKNFDYKTSFGIMAAFRLVVALIIFGYTIYRYKSKHKKLY